MTAGRPAGAAAVILPEAAPPRAGGASGGGGGDGSGVLRIVAVDQDAPPGEPFTAAVAGAGLPNGAFSEPLPPARVFDLVALAAAARGGGGGGGAGGAGAAGVPGLVPLAQAKHSLGAWLEAVDRAGPLTPLSDPHFRGTVGGRRLAGGGRARGCVQGRPVVGAARTAGTRACPKGTPSLSLLLQTSCPPSDAPQPTGVCSQR
jgi:hypothetical protein